MVEGKIPRKEEKSMNLKVLRAMRGMSQFKLGRKTGIYSAKISHFENGLVELSPVERARIAKVMKVPPDEIQGGEMVGPDREAQV